MEIYNSSQTRDQWHQIQESKFKLQQMKWLIVCKKIYQGTLHQMTVHGSKCDARTKVKYNWRMQNNKDFTSRWQVMPGPEIWSKVQVITVKDYRRWINNTDGSWGFQWQCFPIIQVNAFAKKVQVMQDKKINWLICHMEANHTVQLSSSNWCLAGKIITTQAYTTIQHVLEWRSKPNEVLAQWVILSSFRPAVVVRLPLGTCFPFSPFWASRVSIFYFSFFPFLSITDKFFFQIPIEIICFLYCRHKLASNKVVILFDMQLKVSCSILTRLWSISSHFRSACVFLL